MFQLVRERFPNKRAIPRPRKHQLQSLKEVRRSSGILGNAACLDETEFASDMSMSNCCAFNTESQTDLRLIGDGFRCSLLQTHGLFDTSGPKFLFPNGQILALASVDYSTCFIKGLAESGGYCAQLNLTLDRCRRSQLSPVTFAFLKTNSSNPSVVVLGLE